MMMIFQFSCDSESTVGSDLGVGDIVSNNNNDNDVVTRM